MECAGAFVMQSGEKGRRALQGPQLRRKTEFYIFEVLALLFGASLAHVFVHEIRWQTLVLCLAGYAASFAMMVSVRCAHCREPVGRIDGKWRPLANGLCSKCGRDHG